jgi:hypothetical protein
MKDDIVEPIIPVDDAGLLFGRQVLRQPVDESFHGLDGFGLGRPVLLGPARHLTLHVMVRLAKIAQAHRPEIYRVQCGERAIQLIVDSPALCGGHLRKGVIPKGAAFDIIHDIERHTDHRLVRAQSACASHGHCRVGQCRDHSKLPLDGVRRRQQFTAGLPPQYITLVGRFDQVRGV